MPVSPDSPNSGISVVVPVYNEEETIGPLLDEILAVLAEIDQAGSEIIVVDDGSTDRTPQILAEMASQHPALRIVNNPQNLGQGMSLYSGLKAARCETIVTLDGDGQNVPADIPRLLEKLVDTDLVVGIRQGRRDTWLRKSMSRIANGVRSRILGDGVCDSGCALKAMRRETVSALIPIQTLYSFVPALVAGGGFRVSEIPVAHRERLGGTSHYSLRKMLWRPLVDMIGVSWFNRRRCNPQVRAASIVPALMTLTIFAAFFIFLGNHGLFEPDEGRYGQVAKEMSESGELIMPTLNGFSHVEKPPVIYWFTALSYKVFGVSEFGARLPSTLAALGIVLLTFQIAREFGGRRAAWLSALVLASTMQFFLMARLLTADMMMAFWITAAVACAVKFHFHPQARAYRWLFFVFMGIGFLTKGPMALVVPISAAVGLGWRNKDRPRLPWLPGLPLCIAIAGSWFVLVAIQNPELFDYFVTTELKDRFLSRNHGRSQPMWFFVPVLLAGFLPWTFFFIPVLIGRLKQRRPLGRSARFLLLWAFIPLVLLSLSGSKLVTYILPLFPAFAIAIGLAFGGSLRAPRSLMLVLGGLGILFGGVLVYGKVYSGDRLGVDADWKSLLAIMLAAILVLMWSRRSVSATGRVPAVAFCSVIVWLAIASQADQANHLLGRQVSMREIASTLNDQELSPDTKIIASNIRAHGLEFYLDRPVDVTRRQADLILEPNDEQSRRLHKSSKSVARIKRRKAKSTFVVTRTKDWEKHFEPDGRWLQLKTCGDFLLLELQNRQTVDPLQEDPTASASR